jgi:hypothetical protein
MIQAKNSRFEKYSYLRPVHYAYHKRTHEMGITIDRYTSIRRISMVRLDDPDLEIESTISDAHIPAKSRSSMQFHVHNYFFNNKINNHARGINCSGSDNECNVWTFPLPCTYVWTVTRLSSHRVAQKPSSGRWGGTRIWRNYNVLSPSRCSGMSRTHREKGALYCRCYYCYTHTPKRRVM